MRIEQVDKKAILSSDDLVTVYLKENGSFLNEEWEVFNVTNFRARNVAIVEIDGKCYASMPCGDNTLTGILYETRDSFDDLVAQYNAGSNASENGGVRPAD